MLEPEQGALEHVRRLSCFPVPHVLLQVLQADQVDQRPTEPKEKKQNIDFKQKTLKRIMLTVLIKLSLLQLIEYQMSVIIFFISIYYYVHMVIITIHYLDYSFNSLLLNK